METLCLLHEKNVTLVLHEKNVTLGCVPKNSLHLNKFLDGGIQTYSFTLIYYRNTFYNQSDGIYLYHKHS